MSESTAPLLSEVCRACEESEPGAYDWWVSSDGREVYLQVRVNGGRGLYGVSFRGVDHMDGARVRFIVAKAFRAARDGREAEVSP